MGNAKQNELIAIKNRRFTAKIETLGAQLVSLKDEAGTEYIWQRDAAYWGNCSPLLFPVVGGLRNGKTVIMGKEYEIPKHGYCKSAVFSAEKQKESSVTLSFDETALPAGAYPYRFRFSAHYALTENGLSLTLSVENRDERELPYFIGTHPGFCCPLYENERFEDYSLIFSEKEPHGCRPYDLQKGQFDKTRELSLLKDGRELPLSHGLFLNDAIWFDRAASRAVELVHRKTSKGVRVSYPDFETVAFWKNPDPAARYICVEPWNGSAPCSDEGDGFREKNHLQTLCPGGSRAYRLIIEALR